MRSNKKVILTILGAEITEVVIGCDSATGRGTDKEEKFGIELAEVKVCTIKALAHSQPSNVE